jgi:hypothetical protein
MYIESKADQAFARIGRVRLSKSRKRIYYQDLVLERWPGIAGNHREVTSAVEYWVSGPKRDGTDRLFHRRIPIEIDEDVRVEYWTEIRRQPENIGRSASFI